MNLMDEEILMDRNSLVRRRSLLKALGRRHFFSHLALSREEGQLERFPWSRSTASWTCTQFCHTTPPITERLLTDYASHVNWLWPPS